MGNGGFRASAAVASPERCPSSLGLWGHAPLGSSPHILGRNHSDPDLCVLPAPPGAPCSPSMSLASFRSWRKEEHLDDVAQEWQEQGGSRDPLQLLAPQIVWRGLGWRAAYLGRGPGETIVLQHGSPRHWVSATSWGRRRIDATCNGHPVPRVTGTWDRHNILGDGTNGRLMAIGGGHLGQA